MKPDPDPPTRPPFVVGITGNMDPAADADGTHATLEQRLGTLFAFLRDGDPQRLDGLLLDPSDADGLEHWSGLGSATPVIVLSALAPGADTIAARTAEAFGFQVRCPLPFPDDLYRQASSFVQPGDPDGRNAQRVAEFDELAARHPCFPVYTLDDVRGLGSATDPVAHLDRHFASDLGNPDRRYRATSEYVALFSDLLIAIDDTTYDPPGPATDLWLAPGTRGAIAAKCEGVTPGLLPTTPTFAWASKGPVFRLHHPRRKNPDQKRAATAAAKPLSILYATGVVHHTGGTDTPQQVSNRLITRLANNLRRFNATPSPPRADAPLEQLAGHAARHPFAAGLTHLAEIFTDADSAASAAATTTHRTLAKLFVLSFAAALAIHLFAHWHPQSLHHGEHSPLQPLFALAGTALAVAGLVTFGRFRSSRTDRTAHDTRSLAECLRIQFYWCLAGLRRSAAANYLQRQHTELDWIRNAVGAVSFPFEPRQARFFALPPETQIDLLSHVHTHWVAGQKTYFRKRAHALHESLHLWHTAGGILALGGLANALILAAAGLLHLDHDTLSASPLAAVVSAATATVVLLGTAIVPHLGDRQHSPLKHPEPSLRFLLHLLATHARRFETDTASDAIWNRLSRNFARLALAGIAVGTIATAAECLIARSSDAFPNAFNLGIVGMGALLVSGALAVAWAEKNLFSEQAYQYDTMHALFASADAELGPLFQRLRSAPDRAAFAATRDEIHQLLFALGKEALDENADWLTLHRARPIEPVMAG